MINDFVGGEQSGWKLIAASAFAGIPSNWVAQFVTYPGDMLRTRLITDGMHGQPKEYSGLIDATRQIYAKEGLKAFWRGFGANAVRAVPSSMIQFAVMDATRQFYKDMLVGKE